MLLAMFNRFLEHFNLGLYYKRDPIIKINSQEGYVFKINSLKDNTIIRLIGEFGQVERNKVEIPSEYKQT